MFVAVSQFNPSLIFADRVRSLTFTHLQPGLNFKCLTRGEATHIDKHSSLLPRHDTLYNDTQHNIDHNDTQHNDIQHNDTQHNDTQPNDIQHIDTQHNDIQKQQKLKRDTA